MAETFNKSILLVDDDMTLREMYTERLKAEGFGVMTARDGEEALQLASDNHPNVILLDIMMPKLNGLDVLKKLKDQSGTKDIPVIVLTALIQDQERKESVTRGASDYIVKSETMPGEVIEKVHALITKSSLSPAEQPAKTAVDQSPLGTPRQADGV